MQDFLELDWGARLFVIFYYGFFVFLFIGVYAFFFYRRKKSREALSQQIDEDRCVACGSPQITHPEPNVTK